MFIAFSGVSSSGKNTVMNELIKKRENLKVLERSSCTTRAPRVSDRQFNTYIYYSDEEFKKGIEGGLFFEYEDVHGHYYGTILERLQFAAEDVDNDYIRDIDVKGVVNLKKFFADKCGIISIFLDAPNDVLRERLLKRGDSPEDIEKRLSRSEMERSYKDRYDLVVENIDLDKTVATISAFIDKVKGV